MRSPDRILDAEPVIKTGLKHAAVVLELQPRSGQAREVMAFLHLRLAQFYCRTDRTDEALPFMQQAAAEIESLCSEFPWYKPHWDNAIHIHNEIVWSLQRAHREDDAKDALGRMVEWIRSVAPQIPDEPIPQSQLLRCRDNLVERLRSFGQEREANELQAAVQPRNDRESESSSD